MNTIKFNYSKTKEELYKWVTQIFNETINIDNYNDSYDFWVIGVRYKNGVFFEYDIIETYDIRKWFYNYFIKHTINDIDFIYVKTDTTEGNEIYISKYIKDINIEDINEFFHELRQKYIEENKYINFLDKESELKYD